MRFQIRGHQMPIARAELTESARSPDVPVACAADADIDDPAVQPASGAEPGRPGSTERPVMSGRRVDVLSPRRVPAGAGGAMPSDDDLLERTLAFSGSYVSDDGIVTIRRVTGPPFEYSGHRFLGHCTVCARAHLMPVTGEQLADVRAAILFAAAHDHGDVD
jgi:hypothetical protein